MRLFASVSTYFILGLTLIGCSGSDRRGVLYDFSGARVPETPVRLISVDDEGTELSVLATTVTDAQGTFNFALDVNTNASTLVEASVSGGTLRSFWAGRGGEIPLHPLANGLVSVVFDITETDGGRATGDFSAAELRSVADQVFAADRSGITLSDAESVEDFVRSTAGRAIAAAAGGNVTGRPSSSLVTEGASTTFNFAPDTGVCPIGYSIGILSSDVFRFDVRPDGTVCGGTGGGVSPMLSPGSLALTLSDEIFYLYGGSSFPPAVTQAPAEGGREVSLGAYTLEKPVASPGDPIVEDTLSVARKVFVPASGDYARYLEIFSNSGSEDRVVRFAVESTLLTANDSALLTHDRSPEILSTADRFLAAYDASQDRPTVGFVFQDGLGSLAPSQILSPGISGGSAGEVSYGWNSVTIPAGQTRTFLHFAYVTSSRSSDEVHQRLLGLAQSPDMSGMSLSELKGLLNFAPRLGTIQGEAGAVISLALVTATNSRTGESLTSRASRDGSFAIPLDVISGDTVSCSATDGLMTSLTIP